MLGEAPGASNGTHLQVVNRISWLRACMTDLRLFDLTQTFASMSPWGERQAYSGGMTNTNHWLMVLIGVVHLLVMRPWLGVVRSMIIN